jgi:hypothetical protein
MGKAVMVATELNKGMDPTAYNVRACVAPASSSGSCLALGGIATSVLEVQKYPLLQHVGGIKALSEPVVHRCEELSRRGAFTLVLPETRQAGGSTEFPGFGL